MEDLQNRTAREVLEDHLDISNRWGGDTPFEEVLAEDLRRNISEDIVILFNRGAGVFRGHAGVRELAAMLADDLPEHGSFDYTHVAAEGAVGLLEWRYRDSKVQVRDGVDSYVFEGGKMVGQTIHYTVEPVER